ncbi:MAG: putative ABC transporter permease, partial [Lachnospiraceae bacterium]|nr:putative ABC transporter permease [Lachnospiraceae bacterium]
DYSGHFLNISGRICLMGAVTFGIGGSALVCLFLPFYEKMYGRVPKKWRVVLGMAFLLVFIMDAAYCAVHPNMGKGISS